MKYLNFLYFYLFKSTTMDRGSYFLKAQGLFRKIMDLSMLILELLGWRVTFGIPRSPFNKTTSTDLRTCFLGRWLRDQRFGLDPLHPEPISGAAHRIRD